MPKPAVRVPTYGLHKATGQAVVRLNGKDHYLGKYDSPESRAAYDRLILQWLSNDRTLPKTKAGPTVNEVILAYVRWAECYYVKDGQPTKELGIVKASLKPLRQAYGTTPAGEFTPDKLKLVRDSYIRQGLCRNEVNRRVNHVRRLFKWAVAESLVPPSVWHGLQCVAPLKRGRCGVRESKAVRPVDDAVVDATLPHLNPVVRAMVELQRHTGMRPHEVCELRTGDVERSGAVWLYRPARHKTEHHGRERTVAIGPKGQAILLPWLRPDDPERFVFSPRDAVAIQNAEKRARRKTPVQPSQQDRRKANPARAAGVRYTTNTYRQAITYATANANVPHWHPNQLRHAFASRVRREFGLEAAQTLLGHAKADVTQVYAERDLKTAIEAARRIG